MAALELDRPLLNVSEAAEYLNVSQSWLEKQVAARQVPHTRIGKFVRFTPDHLRLIIEAGEQAVVLGGHRSSLRRSTARSRL